MAPSVRMILRAWEPIPPGAFCSQKPLERNLEATVFEVVSALELAPIPSEAATRTKSSEPGSRQRIRMARAARCARRFSETTFKNTHSPAARPSV